MTAGRRPPARGRRAAPVPDRGDLLWMDFSSHAGHEQTGRRPAFVLSPRAYNRRTGLALVCAITRQAKGYPFEVPLPDDGDIQGVVLSDQIRTLDWRARNAEQAGSAPPHVTARVRALVGTLT